MTNENVIECRLCPNRVCTPIRWGRKIDDNKEGENKPEKIKATTIKIEDCDLRDSLSAEDNKLELGS